MCKKNQSSFKPSKDKESEFEVLFIEDGVRYQYGFAVNKTRVMREWLIAYPGRRPQRWFDREYNRKTKTDEYEFGPRFLGGRMRQDWKRKTRGNALYLSVAVQFNSEQLMPVFNWFQKRLRVLSPNFTLDPWYTASTCETEKGRNKVIKFLGAADLSIADIRIVKRKFTSDELPKELPAELKEHLRKEMEGKEVSDIKFMHKNTETGELVSFDPRDESDGTKNLFAFAGPWLDVIAHDKVLFVDEIDSSLHPLIVHELVRLIPLSRKVSIYECEMQVQK